MHRQQDLEPAREGLCVQIAGELVQPSHLFLGHVQVLASGGAHPHQGGVAEQLQELGGELTDLVPVVVDLGDAVQALLGLALHQPLQEAIEQAAVHQAQDLSHLGRVDPIAAEGDDLVQQGLAVPHGAFAGPRDEAQPLLGDLDVLGADDLLQSGDHRRHGDALEVEALNPAEDGVGDLLRLGGREDEDHVVRWLLQRLQQGVEGPDGEHVHLVDDVDAVPVTAGEVADGVPEIADVVDGVVAGAVDLDDVAAVARDDLGAAGALPARRGGRSFLAVQSPRQRAGGGGLAHAASSGEQEGVVDAAEPQGVLQSAGDVPLTRDLLEGRGPPLAGDGLVAAHPDSLMGAAPVRPHRASTSRDPERPPRPRLTRSS